MRAFWIAPKLHALECIKKSTGTKLHCHFRGKGLSTNKLTWKAFEEMAAGRSMSNTRGFTMKRAALKLFSTQKGLKNFGIQMVEGEENKTALTRTVNTKPWMGRAFAKNGKRSLPWGHAGITKAAVEGAIVLHAANNAQRKIHKRKDVKAFVRTQLTHELAGGPVASIFEHAEA